MPAPPYAREIPWLEPEAAMLVLARRPRPFLLESARVDGRFGRFSYAGADPFLTLTARGRHVRLGTVERDGDPFAVLQAVLGQLRTEHDPALPPFQGGAVGHLGYELAHHLERLPGTAADGIEVPDLAFGFYDAIVAFDHAAQRCFVVSTGLPERAPEAAMARRRARANELMSLLASAPSDAGPADLHSWETAIRSDVSRDRHEQAVARRLVAELPEGVGPRDLYRRLRALNPAPFAAYLEHEDWALVSASPERFLSLDRGRVETCPIKGTARRDASPEADAMLAAALLASAKDRAENVMIVDLLRNDLSRVCLEHSVLTPELCALYSFETVHHLVSTVTGQMRPALGPVDLLRATFPGGSITGAPKVRAMEIIAALEGSRRGPYCGAIGWLGFDGNMDTSIAIRTFTLEREERCWRAWFQVGGGITADSDPAAEYEETVAKAEGLMRALRGRP